MMKESALSELVAAYSAAPKERSRHQASKKTPPGVNRTGLLILVTGRLGLLWESTAATNHPAALEQAALVRLTDDKEQPRRSIREVAAFD
jgi:hypothetical protein